MDTQNPKVIAHFDLLGFSNRVMRDGSTGVMAAYQSLKALAAKRTGGAMLNCGMPVGDGTFAAAYGIFDLDHFCGSDTIWIWCSYNTFCFPPFCDTCNTFICEVLDLGLPIRGGIAVGDLHMEKSTSTFLGKALVEAVEVEKSQDWIGASFGPSFAVAPYNEFFMASQVLVFREHRKPGRNDWVPGAVLDWPRTWRDSSRPSLGKHLSQMNTDSAFAKYYDMTIRFSEFSERNQDWPKTGHIHT